MLCCDSKCYYSLLMEGIDWQNVTIGILAGLIFIGGVVMMFTNVKKLGE